MPTSRVNRWVRREGERWASAAAWTERLDQGQQHIPRVAVQPVRQPARHDRNRGAQIAVLEPENEGPVQRDDDLHGMVRMELRAAAGASVENRAGGQGERADPGRG